MAYFPVVSLVLYGLSFIVLVLSVVFGASVVHKKRFDVLLLGAGLILHTVVLIERTLASGRLPVAGVEETLLFYSWSVAAMTLVVMVRYSERFTALITLPFALVPLFLSARNMPEPRELPLILKTYWFEIHVIASFAAYALFTLAFAGAVFFLLAGRMGRASGTPGVLQPGSLKQRRGDFQDITARAVLWGFFFFSASMFAGAIWGYLAWGAYWMWEPKILWSFIVWFWYAGTMHVWYVRQWKGKALSIAAIIGLFVVGFTYLGVGLLMKSSHSF